jgi:hypothetical protein
MAAPAAPAGPQRPPRPLAAVHPHGVPFGGGRRDVCYAPELLERLGSLQEGGARLVPKPAQSNASERGTALRLHVGECIDSSGHAPAAHAFQDILRQVLSSLGTLGAAVRYREVGRGGGQAPDLLLVFDADDAGDQARTQLHEPDVVQVTVGGVRHAVSKRLVLPSEWATTTVTVYDWPWWGELEGVGAVLLAAFGYSGDMVVSEHAGTPPQGITAGGVSGVMVLKVRAPKHDKALLGLPSYLFVEGSAPARIAVHAPGGAPRDPPPPASAAAAPSSAAAAPSLPPGRALPQRPQPPSPPPVRDTRQEDQHLDAFSSDGDEPDLGQGAPAPPQAAVAGRTQGPRPARQAPSRPQELGHAARLAAGQQRPQQSAPLHGRQQQRTAPLPSPPPPPPVEGPEGVPDHIRETWCRWREDREGFEHIPAEEFEVVMLDAFAQAHGVLTGACAVLPLHPYVRGVLAAAAMSRFPPPVPERPWVNVVTGGRGRQSQRSGRPNAAPRSRSRSRSRAPSRRPRSGAHQSRAPSPSLSAPSPPCSLRRTRVSSRPYSVGAAAGAAGGQ